MRHWLYIKLIVMLVVLALPATVLAAEAGNGTVEGKLTNATAGGGDVGDQEVTLKTYRNGTEYASTTTSTDADGNFVFPGLDTAADYDYQVTLIYQKAEYTADRLGFAPGETSKSVEMTVYNATTSDEVIKVSTAHTVIYVEPENLRVSEYVVVSNDSDRTFIGADELSPGVRETLAFSLPDKATALEVGASLMSCCIYNNDVGFVDSMVVLPGSKELVYSYDIGYEDADYLFSRWVNYPTANYDLLVQSPNVQITGASLAQVEAVTIEGIQFNRFSGGNLAPGDMVAAQISGLPSGAQNSLLWVFLALTALGVGFTFLYFRSQRRPQPVRVSNARREENLLAEMARLDDAFDDGRIGEGAYRRERAQKKAQLTRLMQSKGKNTRH